MEEELAHEFEADASCGADYQVDFWHLLEIMEDCFSRKKLRVDFFWRKFMLGRNKDETLNRRHRSECS